MVTCVILPIPWSYQTTAGGAPQRLRFPRRPNTPVFRCSQCMFRVQIPHGRSSLPGCQQMNPQRYYRRRTRVDACVQMRRSFAFQNRWVCETLALRTDFIASTCLQGLDAGFDSPKCACAGAIKGLCGGARAADHCILRWSRLPTVGCTCRGDYDFGDHNAPVQQEISYRWRPPPCSGVRCGLS